MKRWIMFLSTLAIAFAPLTSIGAEGRQPMHVLYLGDSKSPRAGQFIDFFKNHFVKVTMADREDFKPSAAKDVDVVVFDWSQSEGNLEKTSHSLTKIIPSPQRWCVAIDMFPLLPASICYCPMGHKLIGHFIAIVHFCRLRTKKRT